MNNLDLSPQQHTKTQMQDFLSHLLHSYQRCFQVPLAALNAREGLFEQLFRVPFVLLSHNNQSDPLFNFGSQMALDLWEVSWEQLIQMPSRCSAEPEERSERQRLLDEVAQKGCSEGYRGVRVSSQGRRFLIEKAKIWNILNEQGVRIGQGACFSEWTML